MGLIIAYIFIILYYTAQAYEHKYHIQHANNIDRLFSIKKWHFWANVGRLIVITGAVALPIITVSIIWWKLLLLGAGLAIFGAYYFSIYLNIIRGQKWNYRGNITNPDGSVKKDIDYYMFSGFTPTLAVWVIITTIILYFKLG